MGVTSSKLEELGIVDATIPEPLGGAHRDPIEMASRLKAHLWTRWIGCLRWIPMPCLRRVTEG
ncbi:MAG: hypothetical protein CM15mP103_07620 [Gammaproteobacteria bacterium]|nr:MAG: hypothetical protein CM15mP103_07620 [Gammaproteobacteria bacterium]